jgi:hypothetical protein
MLTLKPWLHGFWPAQNNTTGTRNFMSFLLEALFFAISYLKQRQRQPRVHSKALAPLSAMKTASFSHQKIYYYYKLMLIWVGLPIDES